MAPLQNPSSEDSNHSGSQHTQQTPCPTEELNHPSFPPPTYFDNLSRKFLTRTLLREFQRRTDESPSVPVPQHTGRRTRLTVAKWKDSQRAAERSIQQCHQKNLKQIRIYARRGGPDLRDLRGFRPRPCLDRMMSLRSSLRRRVRDRKRRRAKRLAKRPTPTPKAKRNGPYDRNFEQHFIDYGIFLPDYEHHDGRDNPEPENIEEIRQALARHRPSLGHLSKKDFKNFKKADSRVRRERDVIKFVIPIIEDKDGDARCVAGGVPFKNLYQLTDGSLFAAGPDQYYGARPEQLHRRIRKKLDNSIVPSTDKSVPIAPNFFLEAKGPASSPDVALRQSCYNGALGARGIHNLRAYAAVDKSPYDKKAYTLSASYQLGCLKLYASHPVLVSDGQTQIVMTQVTAICLTGDLDSFRKGAAAFQNAVDWAKEQRDQIIKEANQRYENDHSTPRNASGPSLAIEASRNRDMITNLGLDTSRLFYESSTDGDEEGEDGEDEDDEDSEDEDDEDSEDEEDNDNEDEVLQTGTSQPLPKRRRLTEPARKRKRHELSSISEGEEIELLSI
ncbi:hypothetical protein AK830_g12293 [Neonectria ditissima]|uniref:DUF7924 domain-containing protein n=1 Tax=Neonectria ditissima TaxID=78410 RepID=A0A0N8H4T7_9HYPO|nr:hypothetical protein AK830_g12293 [Neonectria ditissima]